jgi:hypothetical protein
MDAPRCGRDLDCARNASRSVVRMSQRLHRWLLQTCRSWKELAADQQPWQAAYQDAFPLSSLAKQGLSCRPDQKCWKAAYR